ncbi:MAG: GH1 family beta-glucosidase [Magnetospirillum sp.]|nr:GH1 family beta-glucosidase [Magnetospirillum sp.]
MGTSLGLPPGFVWGASTAAYQIEGAASEDGRAPSIWDTHSRYPGRVANGENGDVACDHYHRYAEDIRLMTDIGLHAYRFSVAWPRVLPRGRGAVNSKGLDFYDRLIDGVLEAGIQPWLCLYHWDLPQALDDLGGWTNRDVAGWFADYATLIARRYGDRVKHFATFNEPNVAILFGYAFNWNAPGASDRVAYLKAAHNLNRAHGGAIDVLRALVPGASLGAVHNCQPVHPETDTPGNRKAAVLLDAHWNGVFPDPQLLGYYPEAVARDFEPYIQAGDMAAISRPLDWFGLNHYGPIYSRADEAGQLGFVWGNGPQEEPHPAIGWAIHPDAFRDELLRLHKRYRLPIYVTENGMGSDKEKPDEAGRVHDPHRIAFLRDYTAAMAAAVRAGVDVRGYFVWSLLDNFEWGSGYNNRFGLIYVDYADGQKRIPKTSAGWYANLIRTGEAD